MKFLRLLYSALLLVAGFGPPRVAAQLSPVAPPPPPANATRQVTVFGILATPSDDALDPKLEPIAEQLRVLFPGHGFRLLGTETRRLRVQGDLTCDLGLGYAAHARLINPLDSNGKVQLRFELDRYGQLEFATLVTTPLNQLFFCDRRFPDGTRLVLGIGVRP
ncbi:MAG: hypothetical protein KatS3mg108_3581 [Isosphaeraceae bacterium]|jgi:hypothetical protein|nr:MAG: hypothetical protein KatS3mg108_3581 [Isosphaeraceae bacterium]